MSFQETGSPTSERVRHAGERYVPPSKSQTEDRPAARVLSRWDTLCNKGKIDEAMAKAGNDLSLYYWGSMRAPSVVSSYGEQRWNGTPVSQASLSKLLGPEWRETCRVKLIKAKTAVDDPEVWRALLVIVEQDGTAEDAGNALGYANPNGANASGMTAIRFGLRRLHKHWYESSPRPPNR